MLQRVMIIISNIGIVLQRKTDEASVLQKRLHHLALECESGRDKAQAYASSVTPGGSKPRTPGGHRTPSKGHRAASLTPINCQAGTPAGVTPRVSTTGRSHQRQLADVQVGLGFWACYQLDIG